MATTPAPSAETPVDAEQTTRTDEQADESGEDTRAWSDRASDAYAQAKQAAANRARNEAIRARADVRSAWFRNRRQRRPWELAAVTGTLGATGALVTEHSEQISAVAAAPATGAVALAGGWFAWKHAHDSLTSDIKDRLKTGLAAGCVWCTAMPLTGADQLGMWLSLGLGTVAVSARWWQRLRPGYPDPPQPVVVEPPAPDPQPDATQLTDEQLARLFADNVAARDGVLPGAVLHTPRIALTNGRAYRVQLPPGRQTLGEARGAIPKIAAGLHTTTSKLTIEPVTPDEGGDGDDSVLELRIIDRSPVADGDMTYPGPRITRDDNGGVHIVLGPYTDGEDEAKFTVFEEDSMRSGCIVGTTGSGKSRLVELIAIALRELGVEIWYLDPQEGQSSPALATYADWYLPGIGDEKRDHGHIEDLLAAIDGALTYRSKKFGRGGQRGFTHTREIPGFMVIIDEAMDVFNAKDADGITYGVRFGALAKKLRKNGGGLLAVGHVIRLETFGGDKQLRSSLLGYNCIALKTGEQSEKNALPTGMPDPATLPLIPGHGYIKSSASNRVAPYRSHDPGAPEQWLAARPAQGLDAGTTNGAGQAYANRVAIAEQKRRRLDAELAAMENGQDLDDAPDESQPESAAPSTAASTMSLPSITGGQIHRPSVPTGVPARELKPREQQLMSLFDSYAELSVAQIAEELGISQQAVRTVIRGLGETRLARAGSGVYRRA